MTGMEYNSAYPPPNPLEPAIKLEQSSHPDLVDKIVHPQQLLAAEDSAVTKAEKFERHGIAEAVEESPSKRRKMDLENDSQGPTQSERRKGVAPIKKESESSIPTWSMSNE